MGGAAGEFCTWLGTALGRHACNVAGAYLAAAIVLGVLIWMTLAANRRARRALHEVERPGRCDDD